MWRACTSADEEEAAAGDKAGAKPGAKSGGLLSSFVRSIATSVVGTAALTTDDIAPALAQLKRKLMERNVAEGIAEKWARLFTSSGECSWVLSNPHACQLAHVHACHCSLAATRLASGDAICKRKHYV